MLFGKEMNLPFDIALQPKDNIGKTAKEYLEQLIEHLKVVQVVAKKNVDEVQVKTKARYDEKAKDPNFAIGDQVMLKCMKVPKGFSPKLHAKWEGPFYITYVGQNSTYKLRRYLDHKIIKSRIHANRLKHYVDPRNHRDPGIPVPQNAIDNITDNIDRIDNNLTQKDNDKQADQNDNEHLDEDDNEDDQFSAEKLLNERRRNGKNYYMVKWGGYKKKTHGSQRRTLLKVCWLISTVLTQKVVN